MAIVGSFLLCIVLIHWRGSENIQQSFSVYQTAILAQFVLDFAFAFAFAYEYVYLWYEVRIGHLRICTKYDLICSVLCTGQFVHLLATLCYRGSG